MAYLENNTHASHSGASTPFCSFYSGVMVLPSNHSLYTREELSKCRKPPAQVGQQVLVRFLFRATVMKTPHGNSQRVIISLNRNVDSQVRDQIAKYWHVGTGESVSVLLVYPRISG